MIKQHNISSFNFTLNQGNIQLKMNFNIDYLVYEDTKLMVLQNLVERLDLDFLKVAYSKNGRKSSVNPLTMFKILIYSYSIGKTSSREIEDMCKFDLRAIYLLDGEKAPDHSTINRFRQRIKPNLDDALVEFNELLIDYGMIDPSSIYIDGTKIEANANRYTFVWKKSVLKYKGKLIEKIYNKFSLDNVISENALILNLRIKIKELEDTKNKENIEFVYGKGKRKTQLQRDYEEYKSYLDKLLEYNKHLEILGERNSYSKTDHDATFMRMKDDYMRNGQLKPAYNIQMATNGNFILGVYGSHHPSDMKTLPLFLDKIYPAYSEKMDKIICDAGYESEENYHYLKSKGLRAFIKPSNYEVSKTKKYKEKEKFLNSLEYNEEDCYISKESKKFVRVKDRIKISDSGYKKVSKIYKCFDWNIDGYRTKSIYFSEKFNEFRKESLENISTLEGINERINRSIQAEGVFSKLKEGLGYSRFKHKGLKNIVGELNLMALAINLNTLTNKVINGDYSLTRYEISNEKIA